MTIEIAVEIRERVAAGQIPPGALIAQEARQLLADSYASGWKVEDLRVLRLHAAILAALPWIESESARDTLKRAVDETPAIKRPV